MSIINCPSCQQQVRVPDDRGHIHIRCPKCRNTWRYPPVIEESSVAFDCAVTAVQFTVYFGRKAPGRRFDIIGIHLNQPVSEALRLPDSDRGTFVTAEVVSMTDYDFTGFYCPSCRANGRATQSFVQCGGGVGGNGHLVCGGGMETMWDKRLKHVCYCGNSAIMGAARLSSIRANRVTIPPESGIQISDGDSRLRLK